MAYLGGLVARRANHARVDGSGRSARPRSVGDGQVIVPFSAGPRRLQIETQKARMQGGPEPPSLMRFGSLAHRLTIDPAVCWHPRRDLLTVDGGA